MATGVVSAMYRLKYIIHWILYTIFTEPSLYYIIVLINKSTTIVLKYLVLLSALKLFF